jgi:hypothetical protein
MPMPEVDEKTPATCPSCGSDRPGEPAAEPITHCEWCGAEYPTPEADQEAGTSG